MTPSAALVVQADQRILVGGHFTAIVGCSNSFLARLQPDGSVDASFNPAGQTDGAVTRLLQQPDGKVLVSGGFTRLLGQPRQLPGAVAGGWFGGYYFRCGQPVQHQ